MKDSPAMAAAFTRYGPSTPTSFARSAAIKLNVAKAAFAKSTVNNQIKKTFHFPWRSFLICGLVELAGTAPASISLSD